MQGAHENPTTPFVTCNHPAMDLAEVLGVVPLPVMTATGGGGRLKSIEIVYDASGQPMQTHFYIEDVPCSNGTSSSPKVDANQPTRTSRPKRRSKSATDPSPGKQTQPRVRTGSSRQLERFIASLPNPAPRPDLKGTRWSTVKLEEWLPLRDTPGGRQARSKALTPLTRAGVHTVGQLRNMRVSELLALPQFGESSVRYLAERLSWDGLRFKSEPKTKSAKAS